MAQACTVFLLCNDGFIVVFFAACVIGLKHLDDCCKRFVICYHADLVGEVVVVEFFCVMECA